MTVKLLLCVLVSGVSAAAVGADQCLKLQNAEDSHRANPRSFSIPRSDERKALEPGQVVKMVFQACKPDESNERMWVIVKKRLGERYLGELNNAPATIENLKLGDEFEFGPEHVIAIQTKADRFDSPEGKTLWVSPEIMASDAWPKFARRGAPRSSSDSGWQVFATDHAQHQDRLIEVSADKLIDKFYVLDSILYERGLTEWVWSESDVEYKRASVARPR